jgi:crossover junction endodeoxyribonuclease RuvC
MARNSRRALWTAKVLGNLPNKMRTPDEDEVLGAQHTPLGRRTFSGIILGIDPSLRGTGLALVEFSPAGARLLSSRTVKFKPTVPLPTCLGEIFEAVRETLAHTKVKHVAIEETIFVQNRKAVHILGAARGAAIAAAARAGLEVFEYAPRRVKQSVVGIGSASKEQVIALVAQHLGCTHLPSDEADAAATALCHAFTWRE